MELWQEEAKRILYPCVELLAEICLPKRKKQSSLAYRCRLSPYSSPLFVTKEESKPKAISLTYTENYKGTSRMPSNFKFNNKIEQLAYREDKAKSLIVRNYNI